MHAAPSSSTLASSSSSSTSCSSSEFGQYFIDRLLPHVKSFSYTWFHLQAAKRKHFKHEDKRMNYAEESLLKQRLMNESPNVKIKWAVRLLMKLRKDIQKVNQKDLVEIISTATSATSQSKCVVSNPDMKGKMRRIDCLRQSDKVWRLDLVMVVLFKGIPLESSDGERLDKVSECQYPQLCVNPNHTLLNVRDLEVYLANYINSTSSSTTNCNKIYSNQSILSQSVFTPHEFVTLSEVSIVDGASESDIKSSLLSTGSSNINSHYSDDNDDNLIESNPSAIAPQQAIHQPVQQQQQTNLMLVDDKNLIKNLIQTQSLANDKEHQTIHTPKKKKLKTAKLNENQNDSSAIKPVKTSIKINELIEQMQQQKNQLQNNQQNLVKQQTDSEQSKNPDFELRLDSTSTKNAIKRRRSSQKPDELTPKPVVTDENALTDSTDAQQQQPVVVPITASNQIQTIEDHSSCSTSSQQDEEIKELLAKRNEENLKLKEKLVRSIVQSPCLMNMDISNKSLADELKELIQKEKQTTADLFFQLLKVQEDQQQQQQQQQTDITTNQIYTTENNQVKSTTPVFELLMSPLFNTLLPRASPNILAESTQSSVQSTNSVFKKTKHHKKPNQINSSLISALRFDSNSNGSFDDLINLPLQNSANNFIPPNGIQISAKTNRIVNLQGSSGAQTPRSDDNIEDSDEATDSTSPPPPPSIGLTAPSPTKLIQFSSSSTIMHRPIPILQKADAALSSLINNLAKNDTNSTTHTQNNSPLMFNNSLFCSNSANLFANYPNISPANGINGSGSPTSNLFPSITSLFQSPIGTPRVTPTPQQFAAYLFNEDQFHSLLFPANSNNSQSGVSQSSEAFIDAVNSINNAYQTAAVTNANPDLSPLFNNLINNGSNPSATESVTNNKANILLSTNN